MSCVYNIEFIWIHKMQKLSKHKSYLRKEMSEKQSSKTKLRCYLDSAIYRPHDTTQNCQSQIIVYKSMPFVLCPYQCWSRLYDHYTSLDQSPTVDWVRMHRESMCTLSRLVPMVGWHKYVKLPRMVAWPTLAQHAMCCPTCLWRRFLLVLLRLWRKCTSFLWEWYDSLTWESVTHRHVGLF